MNELIQFNKPVSFYVDQVLVSLREGEQNPLYVHLTRVKFEKILKALNDSEEIQEAVMREFEKYGESIFEYKGALLQKQEAGVKYDFSGCGDTVMDEYIKQLDDLKLKIKDREKFLKNIPASGVVDPETGSFIYPPAKSSKTIIKTTLK